MADRAREPAQLLMSNPSRATLDQLYDRIQVVKKEKLQEVIGQTLEPQYPMAIGFVTPTRDMIVADLRKQAKAAGLSGEITQEWIDACLWVHDHAQQAVEKLLRSDTIEEIQFSTHVHDALAPGIIGECMRPEHTSDDTVAVHHHGTYVWETVYDATVRHEHLSLDAYVRPGQPDGMAMEQPELVDRSPSLRMPLLMKQPSGEVVEVDYSGEITRAGTKDW